MGAGAHRQGSPAGWLAAVALVSLIGAACAPGAAPPTTTPPLAAADVAIPSDATFLRRPVDRVAPPFELTDQDGQPVALADFAGKWVLVDWVFTNCATFCPLLTGDMNGVNAGLGEALGDRVHMLTITFDPERDTVAALKAFSQRMTGGAEAWSWLTGDAAQTDSVASSYGVSFDPSAPVAGVQQFDHTSLMVVIGPDGRERYRYFGYGWAEDALDLLDDHLGLGGQAPVAVPAAPETSVEDDELLAEAIALPWEDFELEEGVDSQVLYQFPNVGSLHTFLDHVVDEAEAAGEPTDHSFLAAMYVWQIAHAEGGNTAIGYTENLAVVVEGESSSAVMGALLVLDNEWCCTTPGA